MTRHTSYVSIDDTPSESKCTSVVNQTWRSLACDVPGYCSRQSTPVQMFHTLFGLYGEPSFCRPSNPDKNIVGFAEWNFASTQPDAQRINQITVRDEFVYNDAPEKHVDLVTLRMKMDVVDDAAKSVINAMSDEVRVDRQQHQLYVRSDDLDRANAVLCAAIQANAKNREFVDKPADLFDHFVKQRPTACYLPDDVQQRVVCTQAAPVAKKLSPYEEQKQKKQLQRERRLEKQAEAAESTTPTTTKPTGSASTGESGEARMAETSDAGDDPNTDTIRTSKRLAM